MHGKGKQVVAPRRVHDRHRANNQHSSNQFLRHEEVGCPYRTGRLANARTAEAERSLVHGEERGCLALVRHGLKLAGPFISPFDRRRGIKVQGTQNLRLLYTPPYNDRIVVDLFAVRHGREHARGVFNAQHERFVIHNLHRFSSYASRIIHFLGGLLIRPPPARFLLGSCRDTPSLFDPPFANALL